MGTQDKNVPMHYEIQIKDVSLRHSLTKMDPKTKKNSKSIKMVQMKNSQDGKEIIYYINTYHMWDNEHATHTRIFKDALLEQPEICVIKSMSLT